MRNAGWAIPFVLITTGCSLKSFPPGNVSLKVRHAATAGARPGPALSSLSCFAVLADGTGSSVTSAQVGTRSPSCLGLQGQLLGTYSYATLTGPGASVSLAPGVYTFSIVALHNAPNCGGSLSANYLAGTATETYSITAPTSADTRTSTQIELTSTYVAGTATDRTPLCPPETLSCAGSTFCDTFTATNGAVLSAHPMDTGQTWTVDLAADPTLQNGAVHLPLGGGGHFAAHANFGGGPTLVQAMVRTMIGDGGSVGVLLRHNGIDQYVMGVVNRGDLTGTCSLSINSMGPTFNELTNVPIAYPDECPNDSYNLMTFYNDSDGNLVLNYRGRQASYLLGSGSFVGGHVGMVWSLAAGVSQYPSMDIIRVMPAARFFGLVGNFKILR